jgi:antitoxin component YwqK of YwqJK toxin-antitoxin module
MAEVKRTYYSSGELKSEVFILNDKMNGEYKEYYENGCELTNVNSKRKNQSSIDSFGQLKIICSYTNGKMHGEYKLYYSNGQLFYKWLYIDGKINGELKSYRQNGQLKIICS